MFCYRGLIGQVGKDHRWGGCAHHLDLSVELSPRRAHLEISDLDAGPAWSLGNFLFCARSDGSPEAVATPSDKQRASNMFE